jgi:hypothetical protein
MNSGLCILQDAVGRTESCPGSLSPYWEDEIDRGCVVAPIQRQLRDQPQLAQHLLELRANLDRARHGGGQEKGPAPFLLPPQRGASGRDLGDVSRMKRVLIRPSVDLYWLPLGAGGHSVRLNGRIFEAVVARLEKRPTKDLYHSALVVRVPEGEFVIEQAPIRDGNGAQRGVVAEGAVGSRWAGSLRIFRYEIRRWRYGVIPDVDEAVDSPQRLTDDPFLAQRVLELVPDAPTPVWGRDEVQAGEMWNSNSLISWLIARSGLGGEELDPPAHGRAPGWHAGLVVARRQAQENGETGRQGSKHSLAFSRGPTSSARRPTRVQ